MNIPFEFLLRFGRPKQIQVGNKCRNKETGVISQCLSTDRGSYYGRTAKGQLTVGRVDNFEKL